MSHHLERGQLLYNQSRYAQAADEFRAALAEDPNSAEAHAFLAHCHLELGDTAAALREADEAVRCAPLFFLPHTVKAMVLHRLHRLADAEASATEAISHDPFTAWPFGVLANVRLSRNNWAGCLDAATRGLALDPTDAGCLSLRTLANLRLGRKADAAFSAETALRNDPNDPFAHVAEGWRRLHVGDAKGACEHFRTALRLDPTSEAARAGMIEALKARYRVYRQFARFQYWLARQSGQFQWFLIIGVFMLMQGLMGVARRNPEWKPVIGPLMVALVMFGLMTWVGNGLFNLLLLFHPLGRQALTRGEKREGCWLGGVLLVGVTGFGFAEASGVLGEGTDAEGVATVVGLSTAVTALVSVFAVTTWYRVASGWPRLVATAALVWAWVLWAAVAYIVYDLLGSQPRGVVDAGLRMLRDAMEIQYWTILGTAIGANVLMMRYPNRD
jgi:Tfp pilus assembly protein PilF